MARAQAVGQRVEVTQLRDEYSQTFANPDGASLSLETSTVPVFGRDLAGEWAPLDLALVTLPDGSLRPRSSAVLLTLPGAGERQLTATFHGRGVSLDLPGTLRTPVVDGPTATYPDVFPDVDLRLTATLEGVQQVYVLKSRKAAALSQLSDLSFPAKARRGRIVPNASGGFAVVDENAETVFSSPQPVMWDSSGDAADKALPRDSRGRRTDGSRFRAPHLGPGRGDRVAAMRTTVSGSRIGVRPLASLLRDPDTVYPVYVDPTLPIDRAERTMLRSDGVEAWQFTGDEGMGRCPTSYSSFCTGPYIKRLYYEFGRSTLNSGDKVVGAEFASVERHSASCSAREVDLKQTGAISSSSTWPGPSVVRHLGTRNVAYGYSTSCPDREVAFRSAALTDAAGDLAAGTISRLTLLLRAQDESDQIAWKRFDQAGVLRVDYVRKPATPTGVGVLSAGSYYCDSSSPFTITAYTQPTFRAIMQTAVDPPTGTAQGELRAKFELDRYDTATSSWLNSIGTTDGYRYKPASGQGFDPDNTTELLRMADLGLTLKERTTYRVRALTQSYYNIAEVGSGTLESTWSGWCYFRIDTDAPLPPQVTSSDGVYPEETGGTIAWTGGPGVPGKFALAPNPTDDDPNIERYASSVTGAGATVTSTTTTSTVTPGTYGPHSLRVTAYDVLDRASLPYTYRFNVAAPPGEFGRWHVTRDDGAQVADSNAEGAQNPLTVGAGATISPAGTGRRGELRDANGLPLDRALSFSGAPGVTRSGSVAVRTEQPFTFAAWVMLADGAADRTVMSQSSVSGMSGASLDYLAASDSWSFGWRYNDGTATRWVRATSPAPAGKNAWTLVAGVYDPAAKTLSLSVNGRTVASAPAVAPAAPTATDGPLEVGSRSGQAPFRGLVDELRVWQRAVPQTELSDVATIDPETGAPTFSLVGSWSTRSMGTSSLPDVSAFARPALTGVNGATFDVANGYVELDGVDDALAATGPMVDETGSFTVEAVFRLDSQRLSQKPNGYRARVTGQQGNVAQGSSSWALWFEKRGVDANGKAVGVFTFGRWAPSGSSAPPSEASNPDVPATLDQAVRLAAVHDARSGVIRLHLGEVELGQAAYTQPAQGTGELSAGRGSSGTGWTDLLPGGLRGVRIWAGALTADQIRSVNGVEW
ncbi:hypothetical protein ASD81_23135 [Nocardioides sp. Root614]|nr:hypothetical protein ASD81_23135 [Nocardioides sp. Root614]KRA86039.1 hypothetical protein ASD84_23375 [Nocardioides sp. Root682]